MNGATIRRRLAQVGMTQVELARLMKVSPQTVNKILRTGNVQTGTLERICEALHLPVSFFYEGDSSQQEEVQPKVFAEKKTKIITY